MSKYLDDLHCEVEDLVVCVHNIANPWVKVGQEYIVHIKREGMTALRTVDGAVLLNPSARFVRSIGLHGMQRTSCDLT